MTWGAVVNVLGPADTPFQTDLVNTLEIALVGGDPPESATTDEMLARGEPGGRQIWRPPS